MARTAPQEPLVSGPGGRPGRHATIGGSSTKSRTQTWEVHDGTVDQYEGGYAAYVLQRLKRRRLADQAEAKRQNLMRKELAWLRRGAPAPHLEAQVPHRCGRCR